MVLPNYSCVLCNQNVEESLSHFILQCPFTKHCWNSIHLNISEGLQLFQVREDFKQQLHQPFFMEVTILMAWSIWTTQNATFFFYHQQLLIWYLRSYVACLF